MSSQIAADRQPAAKKDMAVERSSPRAKTTPPQSSVSKSLYDNPPQSSFFPLRFALKANHLLLVYMSKLVIGQRFLSVVDYFMDKLERTLDFCVPDDPTGSEVADTNNRKLSNTERPMSWILFIPALIGLRVLFFYLSIISIVLGNGEVNAEKVLTKLIPLRRYIRSIRYYAVRQYTTEELEAKAYRCKLFIARFIYFIYESIIMTTPPVLKVSEGNAVVPETPQTDTRLRQRSRGNVKKNSLNQIDDERDGDSTDDDDDKLTTNQMLDEFSVLNDTSADPDYEPSDEPSSEDISSEGEASSEEEKTESQKKLNDVSVSDQSPDSSMNGNASDIEHREKSSPPEKGYSSDSGNHSKSLSDDDIIMQRLKADANNQKQEITTTFKSTLNMPGFDTVDSTK